MPIKPAKKPKALRALHAIDFYKAKHHEQYPVGITEVYSNLTPRSDAYLRAMMPDPAQFDGKAVVIGLQGVIQEILVEMFNETFFEQPRDEVVAYYKRRIDTSLQCDLDAGHIIALHNLGYLPLEIYALPEGSRVPMRVPTFVIKNTHPDFGWLTNKVETVLSACSWKSMVNGTIAYTYRTMLDRACYNTMGDSSMPAWQGHDFSFRGMSGLEDAAHRGFTHLASFYGTDTVPAIDFAEYYYGANADSEIVGGSVSATEHSVMCALIGVGVAKGLSLSDAEKEAIIHLITNVVPEGIISIVSDTNDFWNVIRSILPDIKDLIMARPGKVVIRPDTGDPETILCGTIHVTDLTAFCEDVSELVSTAYECSMLGYEIDEAKPFYARLDGKTYKVNLLSEEVEEVKLTVEEKGLIQSLYDIFGGKVDMHDGPGFMLRSLDSHIGAIYGDSITLQRMDSILARLQLMGFKSTVIVFGIGSYTYNYSTRDTLGIAIKATSIVVDGKQIDIQKDPKTGDGMKKSATGYLQVVTGIDCGGDETFTLLDKQPDDTEHGAMHCVFRDGDMPNKTTLREIRNRLHPDWNLITF